MFAAYLVVLGTAVWLCLRDKERARPQKLLASVCTLIVLAVCLLPIAQYLHLFDAPREHPRISSEAA
jgi:cytochrome c oxidase assembly factor CtaG